MQNNYIVKLFYRDQSFDCIADREGQNALGLNRDGITWNNPDSAIQFDVRNDEVVIKATDNSLETTIERNGRKRTLRSGNAIRLLQGDLIQVDSLSVRVNGIYRSKSSKFQRLLASLKSASCATMLAMTAAVALSVPVSGCSVKEDVSGDLVQAIACENKSGQELKTCCESLKNDDEKSECCQRLESTSEFKCSIKEIITGDAQPPLPCKDKSGQELKTCCESLENDDDQSECCQRLESTSEFKCAIEEIITGDAQPPLPCEDKAGQELKECCENLDNDDDKSACCERLESTSEFKCAVEEIIMGELEYLPCDDKSGQELKVCCENLDNNDDRSACCQRLESTSELKCSVEEKITGGLEFLPCDDKSGQDKKTCCLALGNNDDKAACCERLEKESGLTCTEGITDPVPEPEKS